MLVNGNKQILLVCRSTFTANCAKSDYAKGGHKGLAGDARSGRAIK